MVWVWNRPQVVCHDLCISTNPAQEGMDGSLTAGKPLRSLMILCYLKDWSYYMSISHAKPSGS